MDDTLRLRITPKQMQFIQSEAFETLFGGAAGGGKSYGQLVDAYLYAKKYPGSKQLILRRTYKELDKSLIRVSQSLYPIDDAKYNSGDHVYTFKNGSLIDFGYCENQSDVYQYQSAEYDVIRFDELTHFDEDQYTYLISRCRGANPFPKAIKSSTNPGGRGHAWVKARFIDTGYPNEIQRAPTGTRIFIPSRVQDNPFLMEQDPDYVRRLENLSGNEKKALLYGEWELFEGQYFNEFRADIHVVNDFRIPQNWRKYRALDYGLDMLACIWIAVDEDNMHYIYREAGGPDYKISSAAKVILDATPEDEEIECTMAPPDMWNRTQDTGVSKAEGFATNGVWFTKAQNDRVSGWLQVKEYFNPFENEFGKTVARLRIFRSCIETIKSIPQMQHSKKNSDDVDTEPHQFSHYPDAIRYYCAGRPLPTDRPRAARVKWSQDMNEDYENANEEGRKHLIGKWGEPE